LTGRPALLAILEILAILAGFREPLKLALTALDPSAPPKAGTPCDVIGDHRQK